MSSTSRQQNVALSIALQQTRHLFIQADRLSSKTYISEGGYGVVYRAKLRSIDGRNVQVVAVKELKEDEGLARVEDLLHVLFREIVPWTRLNHPNVVPLTGYSFDGKSAALVSPWYQNGNGEEFLRSHPGVDRRKLILDVARGLEYLHSRSPPVIHGDLKAKNVLINDSGEAMLGDFGLARLAAGGPTGFSTSGGFRGTPRWASPELLLDSPSTVASDVWSCGCVVGEVLCSKYPFSDIVNDIAVIASLVGQVITPASLYPDIRTDHPLYGILENCWAKYSNDRPPIAEVRRRLEEIPSENWQLAFINSKQMEAPPSMRVDSHEKELHNLSVLDLYELPGLLMEQGSQPFTYGGFSEVWIGWWYASATSSPQKVAIKKIRQQGRNPQAAQGHALRLLTQEVKILRGIQHPNILQVLGCLTNPAPSTISPWYENGSILHYLARHPNADKLVMVYQVANALNYLHNCYPAVVHGGLVPPSILVNDRGEAVIAGFVHAKFNEGPEGRDASGVFGASSYMAPELFRDVPTSMASDVYAFAMVSLEILSRRLPFFQFGSSIRVIKYLTSGPEAKLRQEDYPFAESAMLWPLFNRCWDFDPARRPPMGQVRDVLRRCLLAKGSWNWLNDA